MSSWMCSLITPSTSINVQRHGLPSAISDHLSSSFRPKAFSRRVILVVLLKRGYLRPCALLSFPQYVLVCSSSIPGPLQENCCFPLCLLTPVWVGSHVGPAKRPSFFVICLDVLGRGVTRQTSDSKLSSHKSQGPPVHLRSLCCPPAARQFGRPCHTAHLSSDHLLQ